MNSLFRSLCVGIGLVFLSLRFFRAGSVHGAHDVRSAAGFVLEGNSAADHAAAVIHDPQAQSVPPARVLVEPKAVVAHRQNNALWFQEKPDYNPFGLAG